MVRNNQPTGFAPRGFDSLDKHVFKTLFFSTSTGDAFRNPGTQTKNHDIAARAHTESLKSVHLGQPKSTDPARPQRKPAPLYQRSMCAYTTQFQPLPLNGVQVNRECYHLFKEKCETSAQKAPGDQVCLTSQTTTGTVHKAFDREAAKRAVPPNFKPQQSKHVRADVKLGEGVSSMHRTFVTPDTSSMNPRSAPFKPSVASHQSLSPFYGDTSYGAEFRPELYGDARMVDRIRDAPATSGYTGKLVAHEDEGGAADVSDFHIGDVIGYGVS